MTLSNVAVGGLGLNTNYSLHSKIVVDAFNCNNNSNNDFGSIIVSCRQLLNTLFINSNVEFSMRQTNKIAYELTQTSMLEANSQLYIDVPSYIND